MKSHLEGRKVLLHDMCLRDGMHAKREQISVEQMVKVATALDDAGVPLIQVTHGAGLGGNSLQHGFAMASNEDYLRAVVPRLKQAKVSVLLIPGMGTMKELQSAYEAGARSVHVATHCTEADTSPQHIACARKLGMDTTGFLMMAHLNSVEGIVAQARLMESYGAQTIYITDSAGYMLPADVRPRSAHCGRRSGRRPRSASTAITTSAWASPTRSSRSRKAPAASTPPWRASAPAPATRRWKCWPRSASAWASRPAATCSS